MRYLSTVPSLVLALMAGLILTALPAAARAYTVRPGDSVWSIARQAGIPYKALLAANNLREDSVLRPGKRLVIPAKASPSAKSATSGGPAEQVHIVRPGESLWVIARSYATTVGAVAAANGLRPEAVLRVGRQLAIPDRAGVRRPMPASSSSPVSGAVEEAFEATHVVQQGDTLSEIAQRHGTTAQGLAAANGLRTDGVLRVGVSLKVPGTAPDESSTAPEDGRESGFVETALLYEGIRYRYGGITNRGMDCSGLVVRVLQAHGISAPHSAKALYELGSAVAREDLQPGDLVFFHTTRPGISHVGIYVGDGRFIHASSHRGSVRLDRMDQGYYRERFVGARRVS